MAKIHTVEWTPAIVAHPDHRVRACAPTGGASRRSACRGSSAGSVDRRSRQRHPRLADRPPRRAVLDHRGVRRGLSHAPADAGRVRFPLGRRRRASSRRPFPRSPFNRRATGAARRVASRTRCTRSAPRIPGAITLHNFPTTPAAPRRPGRATSTTSAAIDILRDPRARRPALQRLPRAAAQAAADHASNS